MTEYFFKEIMSFRLQPLEVPKHQQAFFNKRRFRDVTLLPIEDRIKLYAIQSHHVLNPYKKKYSLISPTDEFTERTYSRFALDPSVPKEQELYDKLMKYAVKREYKDDKGNPLTLSQKRRINQQLLSDIMDFVIPKLEQTNEAKQQRAAYVNSVYEWYTPVIPPAVVEKPEYNKEDVEFVEEYFQPDTRFAVPPGIKLLLARNSDENVGEPMKL